jgi:hypothetical protein
MQLKRMKVNKNNVLMYDFYGKGLLIINRESLWEEVENLMRFF